METVTIPFRGARTYLYGADLIDDAINTVCRANAQPSLVFSYYEPILTNAVQRTVSDAPLSARQWSIVVQLTVHGRTFHVGYRPADPLALPRVEAPCEEAAHRAGHAVDGNIGRMKRVEGLSSSPVASAVIATKLTSLERFADPGTKWLFAKASLTDVPADWSRIEVVSDAAPTSRFFRWDVTIDGTAHGNIVFYRGAAS